MSDLQLESALPAPTGLRVSEMFHSLQGEGVTAGHPAVFVRLTGCDFRCSFCDTVTVHSKGDWFTFDELLDEMESKRLLLPLAKGARLVITGGNPLLQQEALCVFLPLLVRRCGMLFAGMVIEVETQGSVLPSAELQRWVSQWNVSPKLTNSGVPARKRAPSSVMSFHASNRDSWFKFVVRDEADVAEIKRDFVDPYRIDWARIMLMPLCSTREQQSDVAQKVAEMCVTLGTRFSPRLHLMIWNQATGV